MSTLKDFVESFIDSFHYRFKFSTATERQNDKKSREIDDLQKKQGKERLGATKSTPESLNHRSTEGREESKQPQRSKQKSQLLSKTEKRKGRADYEKAETKQRQKSIEKGVAFTSQEDAKSHLLASIPVSGLPLRQYQPILAHLQLRANFRWATEITDFLLEEERSGAGALPFRRFIALHSSLPPAFSLFLFLSVSRQWKVGLSGSHVKRQRSLISTGERERERVKKKEGNAK